MGFSPSAPNTRYVHARRDRRSNSGTPRRGRTTALQRHRRPGGTVAAGGLRPDRTPQRVRRHPTVHRRPRPLATPGRRARPGDARTPRGRRERRPRRRRGRGGGRTRLRDRRGRCRVPRAVPCRRRPRATRPAGGPLAGRRLRGANRRQRGVDSVARRLGVRAVVCGVRQHRHQRGGTRAVRWRSVPLLLSVVSGPVPRALRGVRGRRRLREGVPGEDGRPGSFPAAAG